MIPGKTLKARAVALLSRRDYARAELRLKLLGLDGAQAESVDAALDQLERDGLLSDQRCAEQVARRHRGRHGARAVEQELHRRGVRADVVEATVSAARSHEVDEAMIALRRKFQDKPASADEWARQGRYLQNRGYSMETIRQVLRASTAQDGN